MSRSKAGSRAGAVLVAGLWMGSDALPAQDRVEQLRIGVDSELAHAQTARLLELADAAQARAAGEATGAEEPLATG